MFVFAGIVLFCQLPFTLSDSMLLSPCSFLLMSVVFLFIFVEVDPRMACLVVEGYILPKAAGREGAGMGCIRCYEPFDFDFDE